MLWAIGNVHGLISSYEKILRRIHGLDRDAVTIQVGDMGVGFKEVPAPRCGPNDFWIAGNHDDALVCEKCRGNLGDFGLREFCGCSVFFLRGAWSIDWHLRREGESWWAYEELTPEQLEEAIQLYQQARPPVVITHDCPRQIRDRWFGTAFPKTRTVEALSRIFEIQQPRHWAFGHYHTSREEDYMGTHFVGLAELQEKKIPIQRV